MKRKTHILKKSFLLFIAAVLLLVWTIPVFTYAEASSVAAGSLVADEESALPEEPPSGSGTSVDTEDTKDTDGTDDTEDTKDTDDTDDTEDTENEGKTPAMSDPEEDDSLENGQQDEELDETETEPCENGIEGLVWLDGNGDGAIDEGEQGIAEYPVKLYKAEDLAAEIFTTVTDASGAYSFGDLEPGSYVVGVSPENVAGEDYDLPPAGIVNDNRFAVDETTADRAFTDSIDVNEDDVVADVNAGLSQPPAIALMAATDGYVVTVDGGGQIDSFDTLEEAVDACVSNTPCTITLVKDDMGTDSTPEVKTGQIITLTSASGSLFRIDRSASGRHLVVGGGSLTLSNIILDGKNTGGGVRVANGTVNMNDGASVVSCYVKGDGGGVHVSGANSSFSLNGGSIELCEAGGGGGGLYVANGASAVLSAGFINDNFSQTDGGGVCLFLAGTSVELNGASILRNEADETGGGVVVAQGAGFTMTSGQIAGNTAENGAGVCVSNGSHFTMAGGIIGGYIDMAAAPNVAENSGGGVLVYRNDGQGAGTDFTMSGGMVSMNEAGGSGGGVCVEGDQGLPSPEFVMRGGRITSNTGTYGGGVSVAERGVARLTNGAVIENNHAEIGGGLFVETDGMGVLQNAVIVGNDASEYGGGIAGYDSGILTASNSTIENNIAQEFGGGVFLYLGSTLNVESPSIIRGNSAAGSSGMGGGIYVSSDSRVDMAGGVLANNTAVSDGGAVFTEDYDYHDPVNLAKYSNISFPSGTVTFSGNQSGARYQAPSNAADVTLFDGNRLNNDDINYKTSHSIYTVTCKANNGTSEPDYIQQIDSEGPVPQTFVPDPVDRTAFTAPANKHFVSWNTQPDGKGTEYKPGTFCPYELNLTLYAIWEDNDPASSDPASSDPASSDPAPSDPVQLSAAVPPQTGDDNNMGLWMALTVVSGLAVSAAVVYVYRRRRTRDK